ncbi:MAG: imidazolonepropionase [Bdellovibrionota bacterium]
MSHILIQNLSCLQHFDHNGKIFEKRDVNIAINAHGVIEKISSSPITLPDATIIEGDQLLGLPAFVDCHSHTLFAGNRSAEFQLKCQGASYLEIAKQGGGIVSTQKATAAASDPELTNLIEQRIEAFLQQGVYGLEIKTGYGLTHTQEIRHLRILRSIQKKYQAKIKIWITYLGAHAVLPDQNKAEYLKAICNQTLPAIAAESLADFVDMFVDQGFFGTDDLQVLHQKATTLGLRCKAHIDEIKNLGAADYAAEHPFVSVDHCRHTTLKQLEKLQQNNVQVVLLPATSFYINEGFVHMQDIRQTGVKPAISLDYNPGSQPALHWPLLLHLGMKKMGMTTEELLHATTIAPLRALDEDVQDWCFAEGQKCKITLFRASDLAELAYRYGENLFDQGWVYL